MRTKLLFLLAVCLLPGGCHTGTLATPEIDRPEPVAEKQPHRMEAHDDVRVDDYYWLRERENPDVITYLEETPT